MPVDMKKYHPLWKLIRQAVLERAGGKCELCGAENYKPHWKTSSRVVLTVHHINCDINDNSHNNLLALCQRCHNRLDMPYRIKNRKLKNQDMAKSNKNKVFKEVSNSIIERLRLRLRSCDEINGIEYCKNCGLDAADLLYIKMQLKKLRKTI